MKVIEKKGAGEIFLTSIDNDGTSKNFDFNLVNEISKNVGIPVICHGGGSNIEDIIEVSSKTEISGISLATMLHYNLIFFNKKFRNQAISINDNLLRISNMSLKKKMFKNNLKDLKQLINKKFISRNI